MKLILQPKDFCCTLEWTSDPVADMISDSIIALLMSAEAESSQGIAKDIISSNKCTHHKDKTYYENHFGYKKDLETKNSLLDDILKQRYGFFYKYNEEEKVFEIKLDNCFATVDNSTLEIKCDNEEFKEDLQFILDCNKFAYLPIRLNKSKILSKPVKTESSKEYLKEKDEERVENVKKEITKVKSEF